MIQSQVHICSFWKYCLICKKQKEKSGEKKGGKQKVPAHLPRVDKLHDLPEAKYRIQPMPEQTISTIFITLPTYSNNTRT